jgi:hypothetical protein
MATTQLDTYVLTSLDNVKSFMSFDDDKGDVPDDDLINGLINRVSAVMETYVDRKLMSREATEYYDGDNRNRLYTNRYPITSVSGIWDDSTWTWGSDTLTAATSYRISNDGRSIMLKDGYRFYYSNENVKIIYTAGYTTIPYDIEDACIKQISSVFKSKEDIHVFSKSLEDGSIERYQTALLPSVKLVLDLYRNKDIV